MMTQRKHTPSNSAAHKIIVSRKDLPLYCPRPEVPLWSAHPRVYLPIEETGEEVCPYCGTHFVLG